MGNSTGRGGTGRGISEVMDFWEEFNDSNAYEKVTCDNSSEDLASEVLNYYGIQTTGSRGGELKDLDIKQMDALAVVKLSLLDASAKQGDLLELFMNSDGKATFKAAGSFSGEVIDIYHTVQTMSYIEECSGVMITGKKPLVYRRPLNWSNIWGEGPPEIFDTDQMNNSACVSDVFNQWVSIVFPDPHLDSSYNDGIDNLYEINESNPYDNIIGYAYYHKLNEDLAKANTTVNLVKECSIPLLVGGEGGSPNIGKLQRIPVVQGSLEQAGCWDKSSTEEIDIHDGVIIDIPARFRFENVRGVTTDGYKGVSKVYIIGQEVEKYVVGPVDYTASTKDNPTEKDCYTYVAIEDTSPKPFLLEEGKHYIIAYEEDVKPVQPYLLFASNAVFETPAEFGNNCVLYVDKMCNYYKENKQDVIQQACFLPTSIDSGILVDEIWVVVDLEMWAIKVHDPVGKAKEIAETLVFLISPIVEVNEPAPIAFNGSLLNLIDSIQDHDPTTAQNFSDTEFEEALDEMSGGGLSLNLSFLDSSGVTRLSGVLYDYMNSKDGQETTYICGPNCKPKLGGSGPNGGIINSITYAYSDSNSYTISVNEGQKISTDFAQISGGATKKADEEVSATGVIIQDMGNHIHYKVRIDGFGERVAMNSCPEVLRVGDKVSCTVHNVPVES